MSDNALYPRSGEFFVADSRKEEEDVAIDALQEIRDVIASIDEGIAHLKTIDALPVADPESTFHIIMANKIAVTVLSAERDKLMNIISGKGE